MGHNSGMRGAADRFAFGDFVLDSAAGELRRGPSALAVRPKVYELLEHLVRNAGRLISKEELLDAVWGKTNVSEGSLNRTVTELRQCLGDDPRQPAIIETVARRGYRFIASVTATEAESELSPFVLVFPDRIVPLPNGETIVGRVPECDVQIYAPSVSRRHARILVAAAGASIEDLGSTNGTFVGGHRVTSLTVLQDGTEIRLGKERVRAVRRLSDRIGETVQGFQFPGWQALFAPPFGPSSFRPKSSSTQPLTSCKAWAICWPNDSASGRNCGT